MSNKRTNAEEAEQLSTMDNIRLISGFVLMLIGAFLFSSIVSYIFYWKEDMSAIAEIGVPMASPEFNNLCGQGGALVADRLVGGGFGIFALVIAVIFLVVGWRLFRYRKLRLYRFLLIFSLVLVLGSLTMGYIFDTKWEVFGTGLGGEYGISLDRWLGDMVGGVGTLLVIIAGWIMTGLLINRNLLQAMDSAGEQVAGGISNVTRRTFGYFSRGKNEEIVEEEPEEEYEEQDDDEAEAEEESGAPVVGAMAAASVAASAAAATTATAATAASSAASNLSDMFVVESLAAAEKAASGDGPVDVDDVLGIEAQANAESDMAVNADAEEADSLVITVKEFKPRDADEEILELYDPMLDLGHYEAPTAQLLTDHKTVSAIDEEEIFRNKERIRETLLHFHIPIISMTATVGPTVTLYEIVQEPGVKIARIQGLEDDLAQNLKAQSVRIIAPMPGRGTIGIEVPNQTKQTVSMRSAICSEEFQGSKAELPVVIGRTIQNENFTFDLAKLPHLLVAGATGQGKSVGLNAIITSLLYRKHPAELKFVLIDPKMVEFSLYNKLDKHFLAKMESEEEPIITDAKVAVYTLNSLVAEMENRLELCKKAAAKNIVEYNNKFLHRRLNPENGHRYLPYIVVVIDEFADLIMTAKDVEKPVMRLAQKARAVGIHLIVATQRPDVKVITGGIKANFPARIAFRVMQMTDSRTIIDQPGANQLIGRGDMLFLNGGEPTRIQCAFVDTPEVERIVDHIGSQQGYTSSYNLPDYSPDASAEGGDISYGSEESSAPQKFDPKFAEIAREAVMNGAISTSMIQRNFEVGFNRAGRIMLQLERAGIVGPQVGSKQREIKYYDIQSLEARLQELGIY